MDNSVVICEMPGIKLILVPFMYNHLWLQWVDVAKVRQAAITAGSLDNLPSLTVDLCKWVTGYPV